MVGAVNPQPKPVRKLEPFIGRPLNEETIDQIAQLVERQTRPQKSVPGDADWRRSMASTSTARSLAELRC